MRFQDELALAFRNQEDPEPRRFVLRQMADLPVSFDSVDLLEVLQAEERLTDSPLAPHVTSVLSQLLPRALATDFGYDPATDSFGPSPFEGQGDKARRPVAAPARGPSGAVPSAYWYPSRPRMRWSPPEQKAQPPSFGLGPFPVSSTTPMRGFCRASSSAR